MEPGQVSLRVLGPVRLVCAGTEVALPARQVRRLVAALCVGGGSRSRHQLVADLWGDDPPRSADKVLQQYVSQLRRAAPLLPLATTGTGYSLTLSVETCDALRFEDLVAAGRQALRVHDPALAASLLRRADALWSGAAYEEFAHESFATGEAARLEHLRREAREDRWEADLALGRHTTLYGELIASAAAEPLRERLQGLAMLAAYRAGEQGAALEVFRVAREALVAELGVEPGSALRRLQRQVLEQDPSLMLPAVGTVASRLPTTMNPLRGRATELSELRALLQQDDVRLIVLTGAGGSGKSRLALEVAHEAVGAFAHGSAFLELAALHDSTRLPEELCSRLGVPRRSPDALDDLAQALRARELLLVLDNLEQLREGGPVLVELLRRTSGLRLLVTSRVVLHLSGEHVYPVDPLADDDAVALLVERAGAAVAALPDQQEQVLRRLCLRLDRLPLAIELAATRLRSLTPEELLERLEHRLPSLAGGARDLPARQQTLQATLEWSYGLLEPPEQEALARLAVFPTRWSLAAAEAVCDVPDEVLAALVDHHLVTRSVGADGSAFGMLETVRAFAGERLSLLPDREGLHRRHAEHALEVARSLGLAVDARGEMRQRHADVAGAIADLRQALDWAEAHDPALGLQIAIALEQHWITSDPREGVRQFERLLAAEAVIEPALHATALRDLGGSLEMSGDPDRAEASYLRSLALFEELDDEAGTVALRHRVANMYLHRGELPAARAMAELALAAARAGRHTFLEGDLLGTLSLLESMTGAAETAYRYQAEALALYRDHGGWAWGEALVLGNLAEMSADLGDLVTAETHARECLRASVEIGDPITIVMALGQATLVALAGGKVRRAGVLWGAVEAEEERTFLGRWSYERTAVASRVAAAADDDLEAGRIAGRRMQLGEAIAYALA